MKIPKRYVFSGYMALSAFFVGVFSGIKITPTLALAAAIFFTLAALSLALEEFMK